MIEFIQSHPYLTIWISLIFFFERAMSCGYIVDDDVRVHQVRNRFLALKDKKNWNLNYFLILFYESCYGAGIFKNAIQEHLFTIIVHGINCSLIYRYSGSLLAAMLYLLNPINHQTVLWLNGRRYALSLLAVLLAFNFVYLAPIMLTFVFWLHISGVLFPLMFLFTPYAVWALMFFIVGASLASNKILAVFNDRKKDFKEGNENQEISFKKLILYVKTIGHHAVNCVIPLKPVMYDDFLFYFSTTKEGTKEGYSLNFDFWKGIAVISVLAVLIVNPSTRFWAIWFVLFISQWCNLYQVTMNSADRYCAIAGVGLMVILSQLINLLPQPYNYIAATFLLSLYALKYQPLFRAYKSVENYHLYHIALNPTLINPRFFLSKMYIKHQDPYSAFAIIKQGLRYRPTDFKLLLGAMECLFVMGRPKAALQTMAAAEKQVPDREKEDAKSLFDGIREQYKKEYEELKGRVHHNFGKPIVKNVAKV